MSQSHKFRFSLRARLTPDRLAALLVTLAPLVYFQAAVRGRLFLAPDDGMIFNVPLRVAAANMLREGSLPLWNPYIFCGMPLHASAQGGLLFPLNWFYFVFDARAATNLLVVSTYMVAALGAYLLARRGGAGLHGSVLTSLVYQSCGFLVGQISHINIVQTAALLPWLLWAVEGYGARGERRHGLLVAAFVALQACTGHQQTFAYSLLLAAAYAVVMWRASRRKNYLWSLVLLAAGLLLASAQILPTYELMRNSLRSGASFDFFTSFSLPPSFLSTFFAPYVFGGGDGRLFRVTYFGLPFYGEFIAYVGLVALMLAVLAVLLKRDAWTKFWAAVVLVALALAFGRYWPFKLYAIVYYVPVLNLFRVPARHMMEVDLALSLLAGRGLTALAAATDRKRAARLALTVGGAVFLLTCVVVTAGRPAGFRLAREAPVTLLRAPELFMPVVLAALCAWALWRYARARSAWALCLLVAVVALDLCVWGQSSGWRVSSPAPDHPLWREPPQLKYLPGATERRAAPYRILTAPHPFDPNWKVEGPMTTRSTAWVYWLQPDIYMMRGVENAAGYDGFGLARYSRLAGDMTVWGELPNPDRTLRGEGRELDLLNVRYVLAMNEGGTPSTASVPASAAPAAATLVYGGQRFAETELGVPNLKAGARLSFDVQGTEADRIALLTNLSWSVEAPDGAKVGRVRVTARDGRTFDFDLLAGRDTAEWAYDRGDIRVRARHRRASVATSYTVEDASERYEGHTYLATFALPEKVAVKSVEFEGAAVSGAPELLLSVLRATLAAGEGAVPLRREWLASERAAEAAEPPAGPGAGSARWRRVAETEGVVIYENLRALPRAWLAGEARALTQQATLDTIRTGRLPDGAAWEPLRTALVEAPVRRLDLHQGENLAGEEPAGRVEVMRRGPNRVDVKTASPAASVLVLSENHYPGWRAYVDGRAVELLRVNYNLRGAALPPGEHEVSFVYRPVSVLLGLLISLLTGAALTLWWLRLLPEEWARRTFARVAQRRGETKE